jgi:alpha-2-macroglobulin
MTPSRAGGLSRLALSAAIVSISVALWASPALGQSVEFFSPQGEVKGVRQVTTRFSRAMVPFGDPREVDPFAIECVEKGKGRWADMKNWVYDFARDLPAGVRCSFTLKSGLTALDGASLAAGQRFEFTTGGPAILRSLPYEGAPIDENQMFILGLDAPVAAETVTKNAYCATAGVNERIGVRLVTGEERKTILDNRKSFAASYLRLIFLDGDNARPRSFAFRLPTTGSDEEKFLALRDAAESPLVTLACARTLPPNAEVKLVWGKGIASASGVPTSADQALAFRVRPSFRASFSCERVNKDAQCIPILPLTLSFTAPISPRDASRIRLVDSAGKVHKPKPARDDGDAITRVAFGPGLPESESFRLELPAALKDDAGRTLANASSFPLKVRTDENPPLAKFAADFGILERVLPDKSTPLLPVTLRNVEPSLNAVIGTTARSQKSESSDTAPIPAKIARVALGDETRIIAWLRRFEQAQRVDAEYDEKRERWIVKRNSHAISMFRPGDEKASLAVPKPNGEKAFEVVGIPLPDPGFYVVELASPKLGQALNGNEKPYYARTTVLVTNLSVHFKLGREASLVWVTRLSDGKPVRNARVDVRDCSGHAYWHGATDASGIARVNVALPDREMLPGCIRGEREFFVTARVGDDLSYAFSSWGEGIAPWRYNVPTGNWNGPYVAHAVLDRSLFRAGETVSMKVFVRQQTGVGLALVSDDDLGETLTIRHQGSGREYEVPVAWRGADHGEASVAIPKDAGLGLYTINIHDTLGVRRSRSDERSVGRFRVEAFRVPLMRARLQPMGTPWINPGDVAIDLQVSYLSGGGAGGLPVKLRTLVEPKTVTFPDFDGYSFAAGDVAEGRNEEGDSFARLDGFTFADRDYESDDEESTSVPRGRRTTDLALSLDATGGARATVKDVGRDNVARDLVAEVEYRDPNGETLTSRTRVSLWPSAILLGIKPDSWVASKDRLKFSVLAVDLKGIAVAGVRVQTDVFKRETYSHRRRLIGGFYAYEHGSITKRLMDLCAGTTDSHGRLICEIAAPSAGNLILRARADDGQGNVAITRADAWVATGEDDWWFSASDNDRIDLLPEKKRYEPGDVARFQVRMPFKEATVLVTLEREGVLEAFVRTVKRSEPVIDVPIKGSYAPNVFVSAFVVRGRIGGVEPTALIDLAKPAFKMGLAELRVGWSAHELAVKVTPSQIAYRVRDKAKVAIAVRQTNGSAPPAGSEVAIAAVDEGLLELLPNDTWKLLDAMMTRRGEEVETSTAQTQVIGKRHFGKKAIAAGGGGGRSSARELFDTLLLWKARVPLDAAGNASVEIPLNDSLTSFRIVAIASSGAALFGTGEASIRSTQDLMLLSGLPPVVREADRYRATFTVRNASERRMAVQVTARVGAKDSTPPALEPRQFDLAAGEAREAAWEMTVPIGVTKLDWQIDAAERNDEAVRGEPVEPQRPSVLRQAPDERPFAARDALKISEAVVEAIPERTYQATILQLAEPLAISVQRPVDAIPGRGGIKVRLQAHLAGNLPGVREYLSWYPYSCFEQRASIAVGLRDSSRWDALMGALPEYLDRDGLLKYWPILRYGSDTLTAYALSIADEAGWRIPDESRSRMESALVAFIEGRIVRDSDLPTADLALRKLSALEALSRRKEPISAKWLDSISIEPNLWPTSAVIDWYLVLKRSPKLANRDARMSEAEQIVRSRLNFQGTTMGFSTERSDALWWLMISADSNANRLLLALLDAPAWKDDMPRLARGALGRMQRGHWNTTVANAWGVLAMEKFADAFEIEAPTGTANANLGTERFTHTWAADDSAKVFEKRLPWPAQRSDLSLAQDGTGRPWVTLQSIAAIPLREALSTGYKVTREVTPVQQQTKGRWSRGDVARVHLEVEAQGDMTWVVVDDPIPAGATALGRGLGGDSAILTQGEVKRGTVWPAFEERTFTAYHAYFRYVPKGRFVLEYTVRLNNPGEFHLPTTRVEAMYAPEMFAELPNADWAVAR